MHVNEILCSILQCTEQRSTNRIKTLRNILENNLLKKYCFKKLDNVLTWTIFRRCNSLPSRSTCTNFPIYSYTINASTCSIF